MTLALADGVPPQLKRLWRGPTTGLAMKALLGLILLPIAFRLLGENPPIGIYVSGAIVGCMHALVAIGLILVYR